MLIFSQLNYKTFQYMVTNISISQDYTKDFIWFRNRIYLIKTVTNLEDKIGKGINVLLETPLYHLKNIRMIINV